MTPTLQPLQRWLERVAPHGHVTGDPDRFSVEHAGDPAAEFAALRNSAALVVQPWLAPLLIEGDDAVDYLHRRLSGSVSGLALGQGMHTLQLEGDGSMLSDLLLYRGDGALVALTEIELADADAELIEKYALMDDVQVSPLHRSELVLGLAGPHVPEMLAGLVEPRITPSVLRDGLWHALFTINIGGLPCRLFRDARWPVPFFHVSIPGMALEGLPPLLGEVCANAGGGVAGRLALERLRIEAGLTRHGIDTVVERTHPLEAGLLDCLDFDKGCYPGQEAVARVRNLGHPSRVYVRLRTEEETPWKPGAELFGDDPKESIGALTSAVTWPGMAGTVGLGWLKWPARERDAVHIGEGSRLSVEPLVEPAP